MSTGQYRSAGVAASPAVAIGWPRVAVRGEGRSDECCDSVRSSVSPPRNRRVCSICRRPSYRVTDHGKRFLIAEPDQSGASDNQAAPEFGLHPIDESPGRATEGRHAAGTVRDRRAPRRRRHGRGLSRARPRAATRRSRSRSSPRRSRQDAIGSAASSSKRERPPPRTTRTLSPSTTSASATGRRTSYRS